LEEQKPPQRSPLMVDLPGFNQELLEAIFNLKLPSAKCPEVICNLVLKVRPIWTFFSNGGCKAFELNYTLQVVFYFAM